MKRILSIALSLSLATIPLFAQQVQNDATAPLHLMKPAYKYNYGLVKPAEVKATIDRIRDYITTHTYAELDEEGKQLKRGDFRLTSYEWGVTYSAMLRASELTGDPAYRDYALKCMRFLAKQAPAFKKRLDKGEKIDPLMHQVVQPRALDDAGAICCAMIKSGDKSLKSQIETYYDYIANHQYRYADGQFARMRPVANTVWLDDMFMGIPTVAYMGKYTGDAKYFDEAARQVLQFAERMWVPEKNLFRHGWVESMQEHPAFHWGRANGWAILTMCEVLDVLPADHPKRGDILSLLQKHLKGLAALQHHDGYWHQLLDRNDTYLESSATAIYAYCFAHAINKGWVDVKVYGPVVQLAWHAVEASVNEKGQVENVCVGTGMGFDPAFYAYRPVHVMAAHGYGPVLWAGAEMLNLLKNQHPKMNDSAVWFYDNEIPTDAPIFNYDGSIRF